MYVHSNKSDIFLEKLQMLICIENLWIENAPRTPSLEIFAKKHQIGF